MSPSVARSSATRRFPTRSPHAASISRNASKASARERSPFALSVMIFTAPVARVGHALEVPARLEVTDELPGRLLGHLRARREVGKAQASAGQEAQDREVRWADVLQAGGAQPHLELGLHRPHHRPQELADVRRLC